MPRGEAVLLVDWLNLSIGLKRKHLQFGAGLVTDLLEVAEQQSRQHRVRLARAHFVSENFSRAVERAIQHVLIAELHRTRTAKEQADLALAVLAMDYVHDAAGCPDLFLLATGDQDFVPLIQRIVLARSNIVLIVAAPDRLAPEYLAIAAQAGVTLLPLSDVVDLLPVPAVHGGQTTTGVLGLLHVCLTSGHLGGAQDRNMRVLEDLGVLTPGAEAEIELHGLIKQFCKTDRREVAMPARQSTGNTKAVARRTLLNFELPEVRRAVEGADWVLRRCAGRDTADAGILGLGPFLDDDGSRLERVLTAMKAVGWLRDQPDRNVTAQLQWSADGILEPLWRVVCEVNRRVHEEEIEGVSRQRLFGDLRHQPIARAADRRGGTVASDLIEQARRLGVIDTVLSGEDGWALAVIESHPVAKQAKMMLRSLGRLLGARVGTCVAEHEVLGLMADLDKEASGPIFGYDTRDRHRVLRLLSRARLLDRANQPEAVVRLKWSAWLRKLLG